MGCEVVKLHDAPAMFAAPPGLYTTSPAREIVMPRQYTPEQRVAAFWAKVDKNGPIPPHCPELGPCWVWLGARVSAGYGQLMWNRKNVGAHRVALGLALGRSLALPFACHRCDTPFCVRAEADRSVSHVVEGTPAQNTHDMMAKGRGIYAPKNVSPSLLPVVLPKPCYDEIRRYHFGMLHGGKRPGAGRKPKAATGAG